jgi:Fur family zinc uptake transcriptional regulator
MTNTMRAKAVQASEHDHDDCVEQAMANADRICRERGLRFTAHRKHVLRLVWSSHKPIGAYDILDRMNQDGHRAAPPTVYRALEFLIEADLVHRLDSLNAFIGCADPDVPHTGQFLICGECRTVTELDDRAISGLIEKSAAGQGFTASHQTLEVQGTCRSCQARG